MRSQRHVQPEFAVSLARSSLSEPVALLNLLLKEIAFIKHDADLKQKYPAKAGPLCARNFVRRTLFQGINYDLP
jgi:hypothetical protein